MKRKVPRLRSDRAAEAFLARDLSDVDFAQFQPMRFELQPKTARVNMRMSKPLFAAVKKTAARQGISYQRFIRQTLERAVEGRK